MSMSDGGTEGLFKLAEQAAPDPNRLMPTERTYAKTSKTINLSDAMSLMKSRKAKKSPPIPGGLDDPAASLKSERPEGETNPLEGFAGPGETVDLAELQKEILASNRSQRKLSPKGISAILSALVFLAKETKAIKERLTNPDKPDKTDKTDKPDKEEPQDILERFKKERHRVTFRLNEMEFTVTCLGMIRDASTHTLVLPFSSETEAFFTPPMQSELKLSYDGSPVEGKIFYFGMNFSVPELGVRFLGFLYDDKEIGG